MNEYVKYIRGSSPVSAILDAPNYAIGTWRNWKWIVKTGKLRVGKKPNCRWKKKHHHLRWQTQSPQKKKTEMNTTSHANSTKYYRKWNSIFRTNNRKQKDGSFFSWNNVNYCLLFKVLLFSNLSFSLIILINNHLITSF